MFNLKPKNNVNVTTEPKIDSFPTSSQIARKMFQEASEILKDLKEVPGTHGIEKVCQTIISKDEGFRQMLHDFPNTKEVIMSVLTHEEVLPQYLTKDGAFCSKNVNNIIEMANSLGFKSEEIAKEILSNQKIIDTLASTIIKNSSRFNKYRVSELVEPIKRLKEIFPNANVNLLLDDNVFSESLKEDLGIAISNRGVSALAELQELGFDIDRVTNKDKQLRACNVSLTLGKTERNGTTYTYTPFGVLDFAENNNLNLHDERFNKLLQQKLKYYYKLYVNESDFPEDGVALLKKMKDLGLKTIDRDTITSYYKEELISQRPNDFVNGFLYHDLPYHNQKAPDLKAFKAYLSKLKQANADITLILSDKGVQEKLISTVNDALADNYTNILEELSSIFNEAGIDSKTVFNKESLEKGIAIGISKDRTCILSKRLGFTEQEIYGLQQKYKEEIYKHNYEVKLAIQRRDEYERNMMRYYH